MQAMMIIIILYHSERTTGTTSHLAVLDPEKKNERLIFPTKYGNPPKGQKESAIG